MKLITFELSCLHCQLTIGILYWSQWGYFNRVRCYLGLGWTEYQIHLYWPLSPFFQSTRKLRQLFLIFVPLNINTSEECHLSYHLLIHLFQWKAQLCDLRDCSYNMKVCVFVFKNHPILELNNSLSVWLILFLQKMWKDTFSRNLLKSFSVCSRHSVNSYRMSLYALSFK